MPGRTHAILIAVGARTDAVDMTPERWKQVTELFDSLVELPDAERAVELERGCAGDAELRAELESLLANAAGSPAKLRSVIEGQAAGVVASFGHDRIGARFGAYRLDALIGEGGMGAVYAASRADGEFGHKVAIKVLRDALVSDAAVARFRDERQILASLAHPNIVKLLDGGRTEQGLPYIVMEYIEGAGIVAHARERALSVRDRVDLVRRVCAAVAHAHARGVVHRDIKPSNIVVDAEGEPKLLDFGIAKLIGGPISREASTRSGALMFTAEYASPEQVGGSELGPASDVYSLGAVLFELVTGEPPLRPTGTAADIARTITEVEPALPSAVAPAAERRTIVGDLDNIIRKALAKDAARRYPDAAALGEDLQRFLAGDPVHARAPSFAYRTGKLLRRHRVVLGASVMAAAGTAVAVMLLATPHASAPECDASRATDAWSAQRESVRAALLATQSPMASDTFLAIDRALGTYAAGWATERTAACKARETRVQSDALVDQRMQCLDVRLAQLTGFARELASTTSGPIDRMTRGALTLPRVVDCADVASLAATVPLPADPDVRAQLAVLRGQLITATTKSYAGKYAEALAILAPLSTLARQYNYAPLVAEIEFARASALDRTASFEAAAAAMRDAGYFADAGSDRKLAARARGELVWLVGHQLGQPEAALELGRDATARLTGVGGDAEIEGLVEANLAAVLGDLGRDAEAEQHERHALALREAALGPHHLQTAISRANLAVHLNRAGKLEESIAYTTRALEDYRRALGDLHPLPAGLLFNLADQERLAGRLADARLHAETARRQLETLLGPEHNLVASAEHVLALVALSENKPEESEQHARRALALAEKLRGPDHPYVANYALTLSAALEVQHRPEEMLELGKRASAIFTKLGNPTAAAAADVNVGLALAMLGKHADAVTILEHSLAIALADRAPDPTSIATARFALARALADDPATLSRAHELATLALADAAPADRATVVEWLAQHPLDTTANR